MKELIESIKKLRPTKEQLGDKNAHYAFGYIDCHVACINLISEYYKDELKPDFVKGDIIKNISSKSKYFTIGKEYEVIKVYYQHYSSHTSTWIWVRDDYGNLKRPFYNQNTVKWQKVIKE